MKKFAIKTALLTIISLFAFTLVTRNVSAATVNQSNMNGWAFQVQNSNGEAKFVIGPTGVPIGTGSLRLFTGDQGNLSTAVHNTSYVNTQLSNVTRLDYSTFSKNVTPTPPNVSPADNKYPLLLIDVITDFGPDTIYFDPEDQVQDEQLDTWQTWSTLTGTWHSTAFVGFTPGSISSYLAATGGNVKIINRNDGTGGIRIQVGPGGTLEVFDANVDNFTIGINGTDTTYDFEPTTASNNYTQSINGGTTTTINPTIPNNPRFNWGSGSPTPGGPVDNFNVVWEGTFNFTANKYRFVANTSNPADTMRIWVGDASKSNYQLVAERAPGDILVIDGGVKIMPAGVGSVKVEYIHTTGAANPKFSFWTVAQCKDVTADNSINAIDLSTVSRYFQQPISVSGWVDQTDNGVVDSIDLSQTAQKFGTACPQ